MPPDETGSFRLSIDRDQRAWRYYRNAVERHWDPGEIDLSQDRAAVADMSTTAFSRLRAPIANFGAGEQAVTDDLAPLAQVLTEIEDQAFLTTQLYEEAKHADFFDRYWRTVITHGEQAHGLSQSAPDADRYYSDAYDELFARTERAMNRLLETDTPRNRAIAYCHYHLAVEGILAQVGYYKLELAYGEDSQRPHLPGLIEGVSRIRGDEGRHVGFGMAKLESLIEREAIKPALIEETVTDLVELVTEIILADMGETTTVGGYTAADFRDYVREQHAARIQQIVDANCELPAVQTLTHPTDG